MVAGKSPDWPPSGWTVQVKVTNGRKVEHYSNVETGQKFYSKSDVMRYVKSGNVCKRESTGKRNKRRSERRPTQLSLAAETSEVQVPEFVESGNVRKRESTSTHKERSSERKQTEERLATETNEVPEWLPNGWTMEFKTRTCGPRIGSKYKCYIAPDTGFHCYSKPQVFQYLQTAKSNSCTSKQKKTSDGSDNNLAAETSEVQVPEFVKSGNVRKRKSTSTRKERSSERKQTEESLATETNEVPEWLPNGWTMEFRIRNCGPRIGSKYKCYIAPDTGFHCYSKPQVFQYLQTVKSNSCTSKQKKTSDGSDNNQNIDKTTECKSSLKPEVSYNLNIATVKPSSSKENNIIVGKHPASNVVIERVQTPVELPSGWIKEIKIQRNANGVRKDPYYTDPVSGYMFRSTKDALRYVETGDINKCAIKPKKRGDVTHHYIDETTECKSSLKPAVSCNLNTVSIKPCTSKQKKVSVGKHSARNVVIQRVQTPDELPSGWIKEIRIQRKANGIRKDPYYTDPVSGYMFRSTKDALRYVETGDINKCTIKPKKRDDVTHHYIDETTECKSSLKPAVSCNLNSVSIKPCASKQKKVSVGKHSARNVVIERVQTPDELPSGWIKEIRIQRKANGIRKDPYYTDPVSGYMFRSTKDALRYVETGDINKCTMKPKKRDDETHFQSSDNVQNSMHHTTRRQLFSGKESCDTSSLVAPQSNGSKKRQGKKVSADSVVTSTITTKILEDNQLVISVDEKCAEIKESSKPSCSALAKTKGSKRKRGKTVLAKHTPLSTPAYDILEDEKLPENEKEKLSNKKTETKSKKPKHEKPLSSPARSSKRLLGLKPELASGLGLTERALLAAFRKPGSSEASGLAHNGVVKPGSSESSGLALSGVVKSGSSESSGLALDGVVDSVNNANDASRGTDGPSDIEHSIESEKPLEDQTVPQEHPLTEGPEQKDDKTTESNLFSQLGNCWSDPCLEFAFKTLTGAIPIEDNLPVQGYLQQEDDTSNTQRDGSSAVADFGLPSFFQDDLPAHLDVPQQPANIQQIPPNLTILPTGNLSSPGCSNVTPQQPSIERT